MSLGAMIPRDPSGSTPSVTVTDLTEKMRCVSSLPVLLFWPILNCRFDVIVGVRHRRAFGDAMG